MGCTDSDTTVVDGVNICMMAITTLGSDIRCGDGGVMIGPSTTATDGIVNQEEAPG